MGERSKPRSAPHPKTGAEKNRQGGGELTGDEKGKGMGTDFGVGYDGGEFSRSPEAGQNSEEEGRVRERNSDPD